MPYSLKRREKLDEWLATSPPEATSRAVINWIADHLLVEPGDVGGVPIPIAMGLQVTVTSVPGTDVFVSWSVTRQPAYERNEVWLAQVESIPDLG